MELFSNIGEFIVKYVAFQKAKKLEQEKSRLRKNENIFNQYHEAANKFSQFYEKELRREIIDKNSLSQEGLNYDFCNKKTLIGDFIAGFMGEYGPILEEDIKKSLEDLKSELKNMDLEEDYFSQKYVRQTNYGCEIDSSYILDWIETTKADKYVADILDKFKNINQNLQSSLQKEYLK